VLLLFLGAVMACDLVSSAMDSPEDSTPPTMVSTTPANNAANGALNTSITATFGEEMDASTINTGTFTVAPLGESAITGLVNYSYRTATFTPLSVLEMDTAYTATITTGVKDRAGNTLAGDYAWLFTTGSVSDTTPPEVVSTTPEPDASNVAINTSISAMFSETVNVSTITEDAFTLATGGEYVSGGISYDGTTVTFAPDLNLSMSTTYTAVIGTGITDLSGNGLAAEYTWSFTTGSTSDTTAPIVFSTNPADGAVDVPVNTLLTATFSEEMDASTATNATFTVSGVTGTVVYSNDTATYTPFADLSLETSYTATVSTGAEDLAGTPLASPYTWSFTTVSMAMQETTLNPSKDTQVESFNPDSSFGSQDYRVENFFGEHVYTLVAFNLSDHAGKTIESAELNLYCHNVYMTSTFNIRCTTIEWNEGSTWNSLGADYPPYVGPVVE